LFSAKYSTSSTEKYRHRWQSRGQLPADIARAKRHVDAGRPRFESSAEKRDHLARRFFAAVQRGDLSELVTMLADDVTFYGDGGGKAIAIIRPVHGRDGVVRLLHGFSIKGWRIPVQLRLVEVNGQPGAVILDAEQRLINVIAIDIAAHGIVAIRSIVNPDEFATPAWPTLIARFGPPGY